MSPGVKPTANKNFLRGEAHGHLHKLRIGKFPRHKNLLILALKWGSRYQIMHLLGLEGNQKEMIKTKWTKMRPNPGTQDAQR